MKAQRVVVVTPHVPALHVTVADAHCVHATPVGLQFAPCLSVESSLAYFASSVFAIAAFGQGQELQTSPS